MEVLGPVTGFYIGIGMLGTPAGMVRHPDSLVMHTRVVAGRLRTTDPLGDLARTAAQLEKLFLSLA